MFEHKSFATEGLFPGLVTTRSVANLGHFEIEVIIEPVGPTGGGGYSYIPTKNITDKYRVRIKVTYKCKKWEYESLVGSTMAKVVASITKIKIAEPTFLVKTKIAENKELEIKVTIK